MKSRYFFYIFLCTASPYLIQAIAFTTIINCIETNNIEKLNTTLHLCGETELYLADNDNNTILHWACMARSSSPYIVQLILDYESMYYFTKKLLSEEVNKYGLTPFSCAVLAGKPIVFLQRILDPMRVKGFYPNFKNKNGDTILHLYLKQNSETIDKQSIAMLIFLKSAGCKLTTVNKEKQTPLDMISDQYSKKIVTTIWNNQRSKKEPTIKHLDSPTSCLII